MVSLAEMAARRSLAVVFYRGSGFDGAGGDREGAGEDRVEAVGVEDARLEGWREGEPELAELGYDVLGVSAQSPEEQARFALDRMLSFVFLSDSELLLADELGLPRSGALGEGRGVYEPLTMLVEDGRVAWVFYPLERPESDAEVAVERVRGLRA